MARTHFGYKAIIYIVMAIAILLVAFVIIRKLGSMTGALG